MVDRSPFFGIRQKPAMEVPDTHTYSPINKRRRIEIAREIDRFKKFQCSCNLVRRLMEHPKGKEFNKGFGLISGVLELNPMDLIKSKLEKNMYLETDEFVAEIRLMFSDAILNYPPNHKWHKRAEQLRELFEKNWKSLEKKWETEKIEEQNSTEEGSRKMMKKQSEPSRKPTQSSAEEQNCGEEVGDNFSIPCSVHNQSGFAKEEGKRGCLNDDSLERCSHS